MQNAVEIYRGDGWKRRWNLADANGDPITTIASARLHARDFDGTLVIEASDSNGLLTIDAPNGQIDMDIPYATTQDIDPGSYPFDLEVTFSGGERQTYDAKTLVILEDRTYG